MIAAALGPGPRGGATSRYRAAEELEQVSKRQRYRLGWTFIILASGYSEVRYYTQYVWYITATL